MRVLADFRRRAFCERTAFVHHHDARRQGEDRIHIVLHQHNCAALGETPNQPDDLLPLARRKTGERLVEQQYRRQGR